MPSKRTFSRFREYERVRRVYFPRWDRGRTWRLRVQQDINGCNGQACTRTKTIRIQPWEPGEKLTGLLIHEVAHAVASVRHGPPWKRRMEQARKRALAVGEPGVAALIEEEVRGYGDDNPITGSAAEIYERIEHCVMTTREPIPALEIIIRGLKWDYGMSKQDFLECYPRASRVYAKAIRDREKLKLKAKYARRADAAPLSFPDLDAMRAKGVIEEFERSLRSGEST